MNEFIAEVRETLGLDNPSFLPRRKWFTTSTGVRIYLRSTRRYIAGEGRRTLDIASVEVEDRGQGHFTEVLIGLEGLAKEYGLTMFVESILEPRLETFLLARGYTKDDVLIPACVFRLPS